MAISQIQITSRGELKDKVEIAIDRLKMFEPEDGYYLAFSGGKDSQAIYHLAKMAGVKFDAHFRLTSVDPPELIYFIREHYPDAIIEIPHDKNGKRISMWSLIPDRKYPPTRIVRYCCQELKESGGRGRVTVTGVRWAESTNRKMNQGLIGIATKNKKIIQSATDNIDGAAVTPKGYLVLNDDNDEARRMVEQCFRTNKTLVNPIVDWEDEDVWEFLNNVAKVPHCSLYDEGFDRIGCIGCPIARKKGREREFARWPKYKAMYMQAFQKMIDKEPERYKQWKTAQDVFDWWIN